jgi:hypothetical protein
MAPAAWPIAMQGASTRRAEFASRSDDTHLPGGEAVGRCPACRAVFARGLPRHALEQRGEILRGTEARSQGGIEDRTPLSQ